MSPHQYFRFSWKFYASYSQGVEIVSEKTNIFYFVSGDTMKALLVKTIVVQILLVLLLKATGGAMPY